MVRFGPAAPPDRLSVSPYGARKRSNRITASFLYVVRVTSLKPHLSAKGEAFGVKDQVAHFKVIARVRATGEENTSGFSPTQPLDGQSVWPVARHELIRAPNRTLCASDGNGIYVARQG